METRIYIVRHAETVGNIEKRLTGWQDYEITKKGQELVEKLTKKFENIKIDAIYSSSSKRAIATVENIAKQKQLEIVQDDRLKEMYFGIYDGWKWEDVDRVNPKIHKLHVENNEIMQIPEQETTIEVTNRMYDAIEEIAKKNIGKSVLIASHGVSIEAFLRKVTKEPFTIKIEEYSQHNTSLNELIYNKDGFKVVKLNEWNKS